MAEFPRSAWGAAAPKSVGSALRNVPYGVVHHIGGGDAYPSNVASTLHAIQAMEQHGEYVDIAYNWGVDHDGNLWELRGDVSDGATKGYAGQSFSVLAICNAAAPNFIVSQPMLAGIAACFRNAQQRGVLAGNAFIEGHHWFDSHVTSSPTACPGGPLEAQIPQIQQLVAHPNPTPPKPVPHPIVWKVKPMYSPALNIVGVLQRKPDGPALAGVGPDGAVYVWDAGLGYHGGANGKGYFAGHQAAGLDWPNDIEAKAGKKYVVVANDRARFAYPE